MTSEILPIALYCTWPYRELLPPGLRSRFRDLDHFIRDLLSSASSSLVIVAPYLSPAGMVGLRAPLAVSAQRGAWIRLVTGELSDPDSWNRRALHALVEGVEGEIIRARLRVLTGSSAFPMLLHAKVIIVDRARGYLGSANLSRSAMETNLEVGIALHQVQADALDGLVSFLEAQQLLEECTELALG